MYGKCLNCGKRFKFFPSNSVGKYCSFECTNAARLRESEIIGGKSFRKAMLRLGKHHAEQFARLAFALKNAPREEIVVAMDDFKREQRRMRSEVIRRYKNINKTRRRKIMKEYKETLEFYRRMRHVFKERGEP